MIEAYPAEMKTNPARVLLDPSRSSIMSMIYCKPRRFETHLDDIPDLLAELRLRCRRDDNAEEAGDSEADGHSEQLRPNGSGRSLRPRSKVGRVCDQGEHVTAVSASR